LPDPELLEFGCGKYGFVWQYFQVQLTIFFSDPAV
jgi:hypothetical protein